MKLITAGLMSAILAAGAAGSVQTYRIKAASTEDVVAAKPPPAKPPVVQWAPCQAPSRLENGRCVTDVVRTVIRPAPSAEPVEPPDYSDDYESPRQLTEVRDDVDADDADGPGRGEREDDRDEDDEGDRDDDGDDRHGEDREDRDDHRDEDAAWFWENRAEDLREDDD